MQGDARCEQHDSHPPEALNGPLRISRRLVAVGMAVCLCLAAALLAKQMAGAKIATRDACAYYLPLARLVTDKGLEASQHPIIPPVYPTLIGLVGPLLDTADDPFELAGRLLSAVSVLGMIVCVYALGRTLSGPRVGLAAASLCSVNYWILRLGANVGPAATYSLLLTGMVLLLVRYARKPTVLGAAAVGLAAALAGLTRTEGLLMAPLAGTVLLVLAPRNPAGAGVRGLLHVAVLVAVVAAVWWPRVAWMKQATGYAVPDVRVIEAVRGSQVKAEHPEWWRPPEHLNDDTAVGRPRSLAFRVQEAIEVLGMVLTPWAWALAGVWLLRRRPACRLDGQLIVVAVLLVQIATVARVKVDRRYVMTVAGMFQVWAGLGLVALMERLRSARGLPQRLGQSVSAQLVALWVGMAGLAALPLFGSNVGVRHQELRALGERVLREAGPGAVVACATSEPSYYAQGKAVIPVGGDEEGNDLARDELREFCRRHAVDFLVLRTRDTWSAWLLENAEAGTLPPGALVAEADNEHTRGWKEKPVRSYLIDVKKLFASDTMD